MTAVISLTYTGNVMMFTFGGCSLVLPGTDIRDPKSSSFAGGGSSFSITPSTLTVQTPPNLSPLAPASAQISALITWSPGQSPEVMLGSDSPASVTWPLAQGSGSAQLVQGQWVPLSGIVPS